MNRLTSEDRRLAAGGACGPRRCAPGGQPVTSRPCADVDGIPIPLFGQVEQVCEDTEPTMLALRLHQHGQVVGQGLDSAYVRFSDNQVISVRLELVRGLDDTPGGDRMPTSVPAQRERDLAAAMPMPRAAATPLLPARTRAWLAELEATGQHPRLLAAVRFALIHHDPTRAGRCRVCRRDSWSVLPRRWRRGRYCGSLDALAEERRRSVTRRWGPG